MEYPRLLVLAYNCLSQDSSNGRTLGNLLNGWPKDKIAQFYQHNESPSFVYCQNFFRVTDNQALRCFLGKKDYGRRFFAEDCEINNSASQNAKHVSNVVCKYPKTSFNMILRNIVWESYRWANADFWDWLDEFNPGALFFQIGDSPFSINLALKIASIRKIPIILYNSESYYFKDYDYLRDDNRFQRFCIYPVFRHLFRRAFRKIMKRVSKTIYLCDALKNAYAQEFSSPSVVLYTSTDFTRLPQRVNNLTPIVSYLGNLGVGRDESLIEVANAIQKILPGVKLDVYGKTPSSTVADNFDRCEGIRYRGVVPYEEVKKVIYCSDIIVHAENFSDFYKKDLQFGFSTKVADSLGSGVCFLVYAPQEIACVQYLQENQAAFVATNKEELESVLNEILLHPESRQKYAENAFALTERNHRADKIVEAFREIVAEAVESYKR